MARCGTVSVPWTLAVSVFWTEWMIIPCLKCVFQIISDKWCLTLINIEITKFNNTFYLKPAKNKPGWWFWCRKWWRWYIKEARSKLWPTSPSLYLDHWCIVWPMFVANSECFYIHFRTFKWQHIEPFLHFMIVFRKSKYFAWARTFIIALAIGYIAHIWHVHNFRSSIFKIKFNIT